MEYWLIETDDKNQGGGLMKRNAPAAPVGSSPSSFVCTMAVESVDASMEKAVTLMVRHTWFNARIRSAPWAG